MLSFWLYIEPRGFKTAAKSPAWVSAMNDEIKALKDNNTWVLVPKPPGVNIVGSKWVFCTKFKADGSVECHKARLVAQGFTQLPGFDYTHTFSSVVKASTVHVILSLAVMPNWPLHQLDVNNAFLHGCLDKLVYMAQPPGYVDPTMPSHVCLLQKAIYGLKQDPLAWFRRFSDFLVSLRFTSCKRILLFSSILMDLLYCIFWCMWMTLLLLVLIMLLLRVLLLVFAENLQLRILVALIIFWVLRLPIPLKAYSFLSPSMLRISYFVLTFCMLNLFRLPLPLASRFVLYFPNT